MAWTIAVVLAVLGLSSLLLFLNKSFDKSRYGIKILLTLLSLGGLILLAGLINVIIQNKASSITLTNLTRLSTSFLIITIAVFSFMTLYFFITYLTGTFKAMRDIKKEKKEELFDED